ncbi:MAG: VanZ family protein [Anaerolineae bacterium]
MLHATETNPLRKILVWLWYWLPPLLLMAFIFYVSSQSYLPKAPGSRMDALLKKLAHLGEYTLLYILFVRAFCRSQSMDRAMCIALLATTIYAISDEVHQIFVPGRHAKAYDVLIDVSGGLLLWGLLRTRHWLRRFCAKDQYLAE